MGLTSDIATRVARRCPNGSKSADFCAECLADVLVENDKAADAAERRGDYELASILRKVVALQRTILRRERREPAAVYGAPNSPGGAKR